MEPTKPLETNFDGKNTWQSKPSPISSKMALMTRFLQLETTPDDKCLFTFLVTKAVTREGSKDVVSKEFWCGFHKWAIGFSNHDKHLGVYLVWRSSSEGVSVRLGEATFTLVNRDHVSQNISWSMAKDSDQFTSNRTKTGNSRFVSVAHLMRNRQRFVDSGGEFIVELMMSNQRTFFEHDFRFETLTPASLSAEINNRTSSKAAAADDETQKSGVFLVGPFAWTLLAKPHPLPLAEVRRNNSEREGGGEKGAGSPQLGRTNSWARVAAAAVATRRRNTMKQNRSKSNASNGGGDSSNGSPAEHQARLDNMTLSVSLSRVTNNKQDRAADSALARVSFVIRTGEQEANKSSGTTGAKSDNIDDILCTGQSTRPWKPNRLRLRDLYRQSSNQPTTQENKIYQNGTLDLRKLFQPGGSGSDESSQKSGSRSPTVRIRLEFNTVTAQTEFSCQLARPPTPPPSVSDGGEDILTWAAKPSTSSLICGSSNPWGATSAGSYQDNNSCKFRKAVAMDPEGSTWTLEGDLYSKHLRFNLTSHSTKLPSNHMRVVKWKAYMVGRSRIWRGLRKEREQLELLEFPVSTYENGYLNTSHPKAATLLQPGGGGDNKANSQIVDSGILMETNVPTRDVREGHSEYFEKDVVKVRVEWVFNHLLFQPTYRTDQTDALCKRHNIQLREEYLELRREKLKLDEEKLKLTEENLKMKAESHTNLTYATTGDQYFQYPSTSNNGCPPGTKIGDSFPLLATMASFGSTSTPPSSPLPMRSRTPDPPRRRFLLATPSGDLTTNNSSTEEDTNTDSTGNGNNFRRNVSWRSLRLPNNGGPGTRPFTANNNRFHHQVKNKSIPTPLSMGSSALEPSNTKLNQLNDDSTGCYESGHYGLKPPASPSNHSTDDSSSSAENGSPGPTVTSSAPAFLKLIEPLRQLSISASNEHLPRAKAAWRNAAQSLNFSSSSGNSTEGGSGTGPARSFDSYPHHQNTTSGHWVNGSPAKVSTNVGASVNSPLTVRHNEVNRCMSATSPAKNRMDCRKPTIKCQSVD